MSVCLIYVSRVMRQRRIIYENKIREQTYNI